MRAWQPIETAPTDGTHVDLWVEYPADDDRPVKAERLTPCKAMRIKGETTWFYEDHRYEWTELYGWPSHWMLVPEPPK